MIVAVIILSCLSFLLLVCFVVTLIILGCEKDDDYKQYRQNRYRYRYNPPKIDYSGFSRFSKSSNEDSEEEDAT